MGQGKKKNKQIHFHLRIILKRITPPRGREEGGGGGRREGSWEEQSIGWTWRHGNRDREQLTSLQLWHVPLTRYLTFSTCLAKHRPGRADRPYGNVLLQCDSQHPYANRRM